MYIVSIIRMVVLNSPDEREDTQICLVALTNKSNFLSNIKPKLTFGLSLGYYPLVAA